MHTSHLSPTAITTTAKAKAIRWMAAALVLIIILFSAKLEPGNAVQTPDIILSEKDVNAEKTPKSLHPPKPKTNTFCGIIKPGQTPTDLLSAYLPLKEIYQLTDASRAHYPLTRIQAGRPYRIFLKNGLFSGLNYEIDSDVQLLIRTRIDGNFSFKQTPIPYDIATTTLRGTIDTSLFETIAAVGEKPEIAIRLANLFAWDIDFVRDLRIRDTFTLIVDKRFRDGVFCGYGTIHAARFINNGRPYSAYRYTDPEGGTDYYNENGRSLRKAFLKAPLPFSRISSGYSKSRLHPILKVRRPHEGIDYAAPTGTPIKTVGDGVVVARSRSKAAGRYVKIRHTNGYETIYNHMSRFANGLAVGKHVVQGQVIGYVGQTGYATGPHLDFRIKKNGTFINPLTLKSEPARPVPDTYWTAFEAIVAPLAKRLNTITDRVYARR